MKILKTFLSSISGFAKTDLQSFMQKSGQGSKALGFGVLVAAMVVTTVLAWKWIALSEQKQVSELRNKKLQMLASKSVGGVEVSSESDELTRPSVPLQPISNADREKRARENAEQTALNNVGDLLRIRWVSVTTALQEALSTQAVIVGMDGSASEGRSVKGRLSLETENEQKLKSALQRLLADTRFSGVEVLGFKNATRGSERFVASEQVAPLV